MKKLSVLTVLFLFLISPMAKGQETGPVKYENPEWFEIVQVKYKPGMKGKAQDLIKEHFMSTAKEAGLPGPYMILNFISGEWDMLYVWKLEEGLETLNYEISPNGVKFRDAFFKKMGGPEKAREIWNEYDSYIQDWKIEFARGWE